jgi:hypothetical protein
MPIVSEYVQITQGTETAFQPELYLNALLEYARLLAPLAGDTAIIRSSA